MLFAYERETWVNTCTTHQVPSYVRLFPGLPQHHRCITLHPSRTNFSSLAEQAYSLSLPSTHIPASWHHAKAPCTQSATKTHIPPHTKPATTRNTHCPGCPPIPPPRPHLPVARSSSALVMSRSRFSRARASCSAASSADTEDVSKSATQSSAGVREGGERGAES